MRCFLFVAVLLSWAVQNPGAAAFPSEDLLISSTLPGVEMHAQLFRPFGPGPFPVAIINHGSEQSARFRKAMKLPRFPSLTHWLLAHGFAVLVPQRPGHGSTGGKYLEDQGSCFAANFRQAGDGTALSIAAALDYVRAQPFIRGDRVLVIGNSAGGWGAIALAAQNPPGVVAVINFAGGRGGRNENKPDNNCSPDKLVQAAGDYGRTARLPTLWLYAKNDTYFGPALSQRMAAAFAAAGGQATYKLLPSVPGDGHALIDSEATWAPVLEAFLRTLHF